MYDAGFFLARLYVAGSYFPTNLISVDDKSARVKGRGRGGLDRRRAGGHECGGRCAQTHLRGRASRYAGDAGVRAGGDRGGEGEAGGLDILRAATSKNAHGKKRHF